MISIIISIKNRSYLKHKDKTLEIFPNTLVSLAELSTEVYPIEVIVADFKSTDVDLPELISRYPDIKLITMEGDFSKGKGINEAVRQSTYDNLFLLDADVLISDKAVEKCLKTITDKNKPWFPFIKRRGEDGNEFFMNGEGSGVCGIKKEWFNAVGGIPEFYSWGGEDCLFYNNTHRKFGSVREKCHDLIHQWHPASAHKDVYKYPPQHCFHKHLNEKH